VGAEQFQQVNVVIAFCGELIGQWILVFARK
jgi:hypothetical protein